ncbi:MAG TPA: hypothetical protein ENJ53_01395 [Phaeodactylibacter sp.]|nr:hypothetical protein [Phaeodactylibacter sp.]
MSPISHQPDIYILGVRIQEPVTTLTDLLIAGVCLYAYWILSKQKNVGKVTRFKYLYFLLMGIATVLGGLLGHGFQYAFGQEWKVVGWVISMVAILFIERSAIEYASNLISSKWHRFLLRFNIAEFVIVLFFTIYTMDFRYVQFHLVYGFVAIVLAVHLFIFIKTKDQGSLWILYGIASLVGAILVFNYPITPHVWFNNKDLSHIFSAVGSYFFLHGTLKFGMPPSLVFHNETEYSLAKK